MLSNFYESTSDKLKVQVGQEFKIAAEEACRVKALVVLGDRRIDITLRRSWAALSLWHKIKLVVLLLWSSFASISPEDIEKLKNSDLISEMVKEIAKDFPTLARTLITERDLYMTAVLVSERKERA